MELWIRSQDKRTLIQPNRIDIDDKSIIVWQNNYNCDETYLGTYATKERALQVLNEIQNILQPRVVVHEPNINYDDMMHSLAEDMCLKATQKVKMELKQVGQVVYQMPNE